MRQGEYRKKAAPERQIEARWCEGRRVFVLWVKVEDGAWEGFETYSREDAESLALELGVEVSK